MLLMLQGAFGQTMPDVCPGSRVRYSTSGLPNSVFNWTVTGGTIINNYNDSVDVQWGMTPGNYTLSVVEITEHNCTGPEGGSPVRVVSNHVSIGADQTVCKGTDATFAASGDTYTSYLWQDGSTGSTLQTAMPGLIWVEATNSTGCKSRDSAFLNIIQPRALNLGNDTTLCYDQTLILDGGNASSYDWNVYMGGQSYSSSSQQLEVYASPQMDQLVKLTIVDNNGCENSDTITIRRCQISQSLGKIMNTITPNGDGKNDRWIIENIGQFPNVRIEIYDRWSRLVYVKNGSYENDWDGKDMNGKDLPMDSYFYVIDLKNGEKPYTGYVLIIR